MQFEVYEIELQVKVLQEYNSYIRNAKANVCLISQNTFDSLYDKESISLDFSPFKFFSLLYSNFIARKVEVMQEFSKVKLLIFVTFFFSNVTSLIFSCIKIRPVQQQSIKNTNKYQFEFIKIKYFLKVQEKYDNCVTF